MVNIEKCRKKRRWCKNRRGAMNAEKKAWEILRNGGSVQRPIQTVSKGRNIVNIEKCRKKRRWCKNRRGAMNAEKKAWEILRKLRTIWAIAMQRSD